jgi:hypothetical protein
MESQPSVSTAMGIYYDAMDGDCYVDDYLGGTGWNSWELDSIAIQNFEALLVNDWFGVGISDFQSASAYYLLYHCSSGYLDVVELGISEERPKTPTVTTYLGVEPNPFSRSARINILLSDDRGQMSEDRQQLFLGIFDIAGRLVREFPIPNSSSPIAISWDGRDAQGNHVPGGTYFCRLEINGSPLTQKMHLIR